MTKRTKAVEEIEEEIEEYEVESISAHRVLGKTAKRIEYNIKWKGYDSSENTWEPESSVHAEELVQDYWSKHGGLEARDALKSKTGKAGRKSNAKSADTPVASGSTRRAKAAGAEKSTASENSDSAPPKRRKLTENTSTAKKKEAEKKQVPVVKSEESSRDDDDSEDEEEVQAPKQKEQKEQKEQKTLPKKKQQDEDQENKDVDDDDDDDEVDPEDIVRDTDFRKDWDWKNDIEKIIEVQNAEANEKKSNYRALVKWKDGKFSLHSTDILRAKCPQQLIDYYESKLVFEKK